MRQQATRAATRAPGDPVTVWRWHVSERKTSIRKLETAAAWVGVAFAWCVGLLGLVGPRLGGPGPGLQGPVGFLSETIAALWFPGGVLAAVVAVAALLRRLWWPAAALAGLALVALGPELRAMAWSPAVHAPGDGKVLRVATVNLDRHNHADPLMEGSLRRIDADVLVLPEFTPSWAARLEEWFADDYPHRWVAAAPDRPELSIQGLSIAVWSRLPPAGDHEVVNLDEVNSQIRVPLRWRGRTFALYGIHPWKPYPYGLYATAWRERRQLLDWIGNERLPAVVAGDFNATPRSAFLLRLRRLGLTNASEAVCGRAPATWPMRPGARAPLRIAIDHVMHSGELAAVGFRLGMATRSDHAPVLADLVWRDG